MGKRKRFSTFTIALFICAFVIASAVVSFSAINTNIFTNTANVADGAIQSIDYTVSAPYKYATGGSNYQTSVTASQTVTALFNSNNVDSNAYVKYADSSDGIGQTLSSTYPITNPSNTTLTKNYYPYAMYSVLLGATVNVPANSRYAVTFTIASCIYFKTWVYTSSTVYGCIARTGAVFCGIDNNLLTGVTVNNLNATPAAVAESVSSYSATSATGSGAKDFPGTYHQITTKTTTAGSAVANESHKVTFVNTSNTAQDMTAYYGCYAFLKSGGANGGYCTAFLNSSLTYMKITNAVAEVIASPVTKPELSGENSAVYNGQNQSFPLSGVDLSKMTMSGSDYNADSQAIVGKNVGTYTATATLKESDATWADGSNKPYDITATITQRPLEVHYGGANSWSYGSSGTITVTTDVLTDDSVNLKFSYLDSGGKRSSVPSSAVSVSGGTYTVTLSGAMPNTYTLYTELDGTGASNGNYEIKSDSGYAFTVQGAEISLTADNIVWKLDGNTVSNGASVDYNGSIHQVSVDASALAQYGVKIDTSKGTNGFEAYNGTNAGDYTTTVWLTNYDSTYKPYSASFTFTWHISKINYDFSGVYWTYAEGSQRYDTAKGVEYNETKYTLQIAGLPSGLSVSVYSGTQSATNAGDYTIGVQTLSGADSNHNAPDLSLLSLNWKITKKPIAVVWTSTEVDFGEDMQVIPNVATSNIYTVHYYASSDWDTANNAPKAGATKLAITDIQYDGVSTVTYYVYADFIYDSDSANYSLTGQRAMDFTLSSDKTAVSISVGPAHKVYDGKPFAPQAVASLSNGQNISLELVSEYFSDSSLSNKLSGAPTDAGTYYLKVSIGSRHTGQYKNIGTSEFEIVIDKADYDLSGLRWSVGGQTFALTDSVSVVYNSDTYTLELLGAGDIANFNVTLSGDTTGKNVGSYTVTPTVASNDNYNDCALDSLTWRITPLAVDLSGVTWNYSEAFTYTRENGEAKTFSVALNLPDGLLPELQTAINSIQSGEFSNSTVGTYSATARFSDLANAQGIQGNYEITLPNLQATLVWEISERRISAPINSGSWAEFDGELHDIAALCGLPDDWAEYLDISVNFTSPSGAESTPDGFRFTNAGEYKVTFSVKAGINGAQPNVLLGEDDEPKSVDIEVATLDLTVIGWNGSTSSATAKFSSAVPSSVFSYIFYDEDGNEVELSVIQNKTPGTYSKTIRPSENYSVTFEEEVAEQVVFTITEQGETPVEPDDPTPPPVEPDDPTPPSSDDPTPPMEDGGKDVGAKIKEFFEKLLASNFPLWQVIVMGVSALLALIFMIKAIQYGNRAKKAKGTGGKASKAYAALLPIFSTQSVALGLSNMIWSIMAFAFVGLALLMFVIALITRHSWKKAERNALNGSNADSQHSSELSELKAQLALMSSQQGGQSASDSIAIIEAMRREMDERRREDEERHRREMEEREARYREEQEKRDDAMKAMLAGIMGSRNVGEDDMIYGTLDDTDMLVQRVIAGLLPSIQQMIPEPTAYLTAPGEQNEELLHIVEEQNAQMQAMSAQMNELQAQLASVHEIADAVIMPDNNNDEIMAEMTALREQISKLGSQPATVVAADTGEMSAKIDALQKQIADLNKGGEATTVINGNSDEMRAMADEMNAMRKQMAILAQSQFDSSIIDEYDDDDFDFDDEEEWDSILDEDEDDNFVESVIIEADGTVRKTYPNFRMRLKESSEQNREWYAAIKNLFCSQKGVTYRVCKRVEKIRYQGQIIGVIGIAKRSIKLWLALKPYEYDARRYHHKDVSDKPRFVDVPLYVRVGSDRALTRAQELILALFQDFNMEARKRYNDRDIQELIFTLKHNKLLTNKQYKRALCQIIHIHDCNVLDDETAQKCIEFKNVDFIDDSVIETVKLDDIDTYFQDGNRVTLEKLRKVGLVSEECTGYTVVADKRLTKPLIIVANDFTLPAVKMIALTGGRVIKLNQV